MAFSTNQIFYLIWKTGEGKPMVITFAVALRMIKIHICGQPSAAIKRELSFVYQCHRHWKVLIYSNSKTNVETTLTSLSEAVLESKSIEREFIPPIGDCGIMMKSYLMAEFCGNDPDENSDDDESLGEKVTLPEICLMP